LLFATAGEGEKSSRERAAALREGREGAQVAVHRMFGIFCMLRICWDNPCSFRGISWDAVANEKTCPVCSLGSNAWGQPLLQAQLLGAVLLSHL